ncbi:MAG: acyl-CoA thioesterase [Elusimicrobia bacterium]|nr:acyl-CoA thioesterase [Elusimicrobiota bacterium]MDE2313490.1 acyl-CoA thioesterase [Elusimicrobiota bacterium]
MPKAKPVRESLTQLADLMSPPDANMRGTVFGGKILQMVDKAAAVCAMRHAGRECVTVAMERVEFLVPIQIGHLVTVEARVNFVGRTSLEIGVEVYAEDTALGERRHTNSCLATMVAVDKNGRPASVPGLVLETPEDKKRHAEALARRKRRTGA